MTKSLNIGARASLGKAWEGLILPIFLKDAENDPKWSYPRGLTEINTALKSYIERTATKVSKYKTIQFDLGPDKRVIVLFLPAKLLSYELLQSCRKVVELLTSFAANDIACYIPTSKSFYMDVVDGIVSASVAGSFRPKRYSKKSSPPPTKQKITIVVDKEQHHQYLGRAKKSKIVAEGTNMVRYLTMQAGNDLTPQGFKKTAKDLSQSEKLGFHFYSQAKLSQMGAGAFLAVCQGSAHTGSGIIKLSYVGKPNKKRKLTLIGKGITYDTGGVNLKPPAHMFGMHGDMGGAALALAFLITASRLQLPLDIDCYLAVADNAIGDRAYRPNDVIHSLSGKSIEVVHTDAEGRMVLADTIFLATKNKSDLVLDFATLTGSCVAAIGTTYMGCFSNSDHLANMAVSSGKNSGERVWSFPLDEDFGDCLESDVADLKQCRLKGGVDHIEAAWFLKQFLAEDRPWIHFDLSSCENDSGLGHVGTSVTGVGVRMLTLLIESYFGL